MTSDWNLVVFDMDGVLVDTHSSWRWVHDKFRVDNDKSLEAYMEGEITDLEFIRRDIELWRSIDPEISKEDITDILKDAPKMNGFNRSIPYIGENFNTAIISGGLKPLAEHVGGKHFDRIMANDIEEREDKLTGEGVLEVKLRDKGEAFERLLSDFGVDEDECVAIGNSHVDTPMIRKSGLGIAFNPADEEVIESADVIIEEKDLSLLLDHI